MADDNELEELLGWIGVLLRNSDHREYVGIRDAWKKYWRKNGNKESGTEKTNTQNATRRQNKKGRPTS